MKSPVSVEQILAWADDHRARVGDWPTHRSGPIPGAPGESWAKVQSALRFGHRGLPGGSSLHLLLQRRRGMRDRTHAKPLRIKQILAWADAHHRRTLIWPGAGSGTIAEAPGENWKKVDHALRLGLRGLLGGTTLTRFLTKHRGVWNRKDRPVLTIGRILEYAEDHRRREGKWPAIKSGPVYLAPDDTWSAINRALWTGIRGLAGGTSLARLLAQRKGARNRKALPPLTQTKILTWADEHHKRTGEWPVPSSGPIWAAPGERWSAVQRALESGRRGLPGGMTLGRLLALHRNARRHKSLPSLSIKQVLAWADAHHAKTGRWPTAQSGVIDGAGGESWGGIVSALAEGRRGFSKRSTLPQLLTKYRNKRPATLPTNLSFKRILGWADAHHKRTGDWPTAASGRIPGTRFETWSGIDRALSKGRRGVTRRMTLRKLLALRRGVRHRGVSANQARGALRRL